MENIEPKAEAKKCWHCWHDSGVILTSNPPIPVLICCHCGERKNARELNHQQKHGPYLPAHEQWKI